MEKALTGFFSFEKLADEKFNLSFLSIHFDQNSKKQTADPKEKHIPLLCGVVTHK